MFYEDDPEGTSLLSMLFQIQQIAHRSMQNLQDRMREKEITISTYQRFFKDNKAAYRSFFALLASCSLSGIDLSRRVANAQERYDLVSAFLQKTLNAVHSSPQKFERYYRFAMNATASAIPSEKDPDAGKQLLWQVVRRANFGSLLEKMQLEALTYDL